MAHRRARRSTPILLQGPDSTSSPARACSVVTSPPRPVVKEGVEEEVGEETDLVLTQVLEESKRTAVKDEMRRWDSLAEVLHQPAMEAHQPPLMPKPEPWCASMEVAHDHTCSTSPRSTLLAILDWPGPPAASAARRSSPPTRLPQTHLWTVLPYIDLCGDDDDEE